MSISVLQRRAAAGSSWLQWALTCDGPGGLIGPGRPQRRTYLQGVPAGGWQQWALTCEHDNAAAPCSCWQQLAAISCDIQGWCAGSADCGWGWASTAGLTVSTRSTWQQRALMCEQLVAAALFGVRPGVSVVYLPGSTWLRWAVMWGDE